MVEIYASRPDPADPNKRTKPWKTIADQVEFRTQAGVVTVFWNESAGRLRIHSNDLHELVPHWVAGNVLEIEVVNEPASNPGYTK
jgi:hypothetical protein